MGNYWDTLGWVEFVDGNLDKAQKFATAAWQLDPSAAKSDHLGQIYEKKGNKQEAAHYYALSLNARRPDPETRTRLAGVLGGENKVDGVVEKYHDELQQLRTFKIPNTPKQKITGDFLVILSIAPPAQTTVEAARPVDADNKLKTFTDLVRSAKYGQTVPDDNSIQLLRRGTLRCATASEDCTFVLELPEDVKSAE